MNITFKLSFIMNTLTTYIIVSSGDSIDINNVNYTKSVW